MWLFGKQSSIKEDVAVDVIGDYKIGAFLGRGSFGVVKAAQHSSSEDKVAIKIVPTGTVNDDKLLTEIRNHRLMSHPHIVQVLDVIEGANNMYIVMELVTGGDLFDYIVKSHPRLADRDARRIFQQIVAGVEHSHERGVAHRDLKPENIFVDAKGNVKIGDFGLSAEMRAGVLLTDSCGSPNYAAPELLYKECKYEGPEVDIWSLGVILYALLCSSLPFDAPEFSELFRIIKRGRYSVPGFVSPEAKNLIGRMLVVDMAKRASIPEIKNDPWFQKDLPAKLEKKVAPPLPSLLFDRRPSERATRASSKTMDTTPSASTSWGGASKSYASLEKAVLVKRGDTHQRCASSLTLASISTTTSENNSPKDVPPPAPSVDIRRNSLSYCHTGYSIEAAMYVFTNQLAF